MATAQTWSGRILTAIALPLLLTATAAAAGLPTVHPPIALHPKNPHYFLFRGKPALLVTSGEHYGAVLNRAFDYVRYLDVLQSHGFNQTRAFSGTYREVPGSFGIEQNTLAPTRDAFLCPWPRGDAPGAADGGNKFDLSRWDPAYFNRLRDFVAEAGRRGIVVELVLFCTMYDEALWAASPMNAANNVQGVGKVGRHEVYSAKDAALTAAQEAVVRKLVGDLKDFDNVYFEICNEPYERGGLTADWNGRMVAAVVVAEADRPAKHLIAQGIAPRTKVVGANSHVSVFNFHASATENVDLNYHLGRAVADDETGGKGTDDFPYRAEAWEFLLAGGAVVSHLDFSFTCGQPDGAVKLAGVPGGGGPAIRRQLQVLKQFVERFDFVSMKPDPNVLKGDMPAGTTARVLSEPGKAYAIYLRGGTGVTLSLALPAGSYRAEWLAPATGKVVQARGVEADGDGGSRLTSPPYEDDIALRVTRRSGGRGLNRRTE